MFISLTSRVFPVSQRAGQISLPPDFFLWGCVADFSSSSSARCELKCLSVFFKYSATRSEPSGCRRLYFYLAKVVFWMYQRTSLLWLLWMNKIAVGADGHLLPLNPALSVPRHSYMYSSKQTRHPFARICLILMRILVFSRPVWRWPEGEDTKTTISRPARCVSGTNRWVSGGCVHVFTAWSESSQLDLNMLFV